MEKAKNFDDIICLLFIPPYIVDAPVVSKSLFSLPELQKVMINMGETLSEDEVTKMMIQADQDSDGLVSFEEFVVMMAK